MDSNTVLYPVINGIYHHYKGGKYQVITLATHTETNEPMVIYKSLLFGSVYCRPLSNFIELINDTTKRFLLM